MKAADYCTETEMHLLWVLPPPHRFASRRVIPVVELVLLLGLLLSFCRRSIHLVLHGLMVLLAIVQRVPELQSIMFVCP